MSQRPIGAVLVHEHPVRLVDVMSGSRVRRPRPAIAKIAEGSVDRPDGKAVPFEAVLNAEADVEVTVMGRRFVVTSESIVEAVLNELTSSEICEAMAVRKHLSTCKANPVFRGADRRAVSHDEADLACLACGATVRIHRTLDALPEDAGPTGDAGPS